MRKFLLDTVAGATGAVLAAVILAAGTFAIGRATADQTVVQMDDTHAIAASIDGVESSDGSDQINDVVRVSGHAQNLPAGSEIRLLVKHDEDVDYYLNPTPIQLDEDDSWFDETTLGDASLRVPALYDLYVVMAPASVLNRWAAANPNGFRELDPRMSLLAVEEVTREV
jgi:hypothetical protein